MTGHSRGGEVGIAVVTHNRRRSLIETLARLTRLPERPPTVVVDNASTDGTAAAVAATFPQVDVVGLESNLGASARNAGAERLGTPYVAFCDDDSWWCPGSLREAAAAFRAYPRLGLVAARILVGESRRLDPTSAAMAGPTPPGLPGPPVDGFVACGAVVRREAFLRAGGFCERFGVGGEERLLSIDLRAAGWQLCYLPAVVAVHDPVQAEREGRERTLRRNDLWTSWMRSPLVGALQDTTRLARDSVQDPVARGALREALRGLPWAISRRISRNGSSGDEGLGR